MFQTPHNLALLGPLGVPELLLIGALLLLLFGGKKIPKIAKGIASSLSEFRKGKNEYSKDLTQTSKPHDQ